jgi:hypothetical protein
MIKHIVSFKLKDEFTNKASLIKDALDGLPVKILEIKTFEVGINIADTDSAYDLVLVSEFESLDDLNTYRVHPEHQKVVELIAKYKLTSMVVDYKI